MPVLKFNTDNFLDNWESFRRGGRFQVDALSFPRQGICNVLTWFEVKVDPVHAPVLVVIVLQVLIILLSIKKTLVMLSHVHQ